MPQFKKRFTRS